jgi:hypothetical protein
MTPNSRELAPDRVFAVQFSSDADPTCERMLGRVEHVESGKRCHFNSLEELVGFMEEVLDALNQAPKTPQ